MSNNVQIGPRARTTDRNRGNVSGGGVGYYLTAALALRKITTTDNRLQSNRFTRHVLLPRRNTRSSDAGVRKATIDQNIDNILRLEKKLKKSHLVLFNIGRKLFNEEEQNFKMISCKTWRNFNSFLKWSMIYSMLMNINTLKKV